MTTGYDLKRWVDKHDLHDYRLVPRTKDPDAKAFKTDNGVLFYAVKPSKKLGATAQQALDWLKRYQAFHRELVPLGEQDNYEAYRIFPESPYLPFFAYVTKSEDYALYRLVTRDDKGRPVSTLVTAYHPADALQSGYTFLTQYDITHVRVLKLTDIADLNEDERWTLSDHRRRLLEHGTMV